MYKNVVIVKASVTYILFISFKELFREFKKMSGKYSGYVVTSKFVQLGR